MKIGDLILFTSGEYSDYRPVALCRVLATFDKLEELRAFLVEHPEQVGEYEGEPSSFVLWLTNRELVEEADNTELWLGDYGNWDVVLESWERRPNAPKGIKLDKE